MTETNGTPGDYRREGSDYSGGTKNQVRCVRELVGSYAGHQVHA